MIIRRLIPRVISHSFFRFNSTNQLLKSLNNRGDYEGAFQLFDRLIKQNNVSIISLVNILDTCTRSGQIERARQIEIFINESNQWKYHIPLQTSLINMYMKCQMIEQGKNMKIYSTKK